MRKCHYLLIVIISLIACKSDTDSINVSAFIDPEFETIVDKFYKEAELRNVFIRPKEVLQVRFVDDLQEGICGFGNSSFGPSSIPRVIIKEECWRGQTDLEKENFLFHELGHALLSHGHNRKKFPNGYPSSIMCGIINGEEQCNNWQVYYHTGEMRSYYVDELFRLDPQTPSWVAGTKFHEILMYDSIGSELEGWEGFSFPEDDSYSLYLDSTNAFDGSKSLGIASDGTVPNTDQSGAIWTRKIDLNAFEDCTNVKARAKIKSQPFNGYVYISLSLREYDDSGQEHRFMIHRTERFSHEEVNNSEWLEVEIYCIPKRSDIITVGFGFQSDIVSTVSADEFTVEFWK